MNYETRAVEEVRVGDRIYNRHAYHPRAAWLEVVEVLKEGGYIRLRTGVYDEIRHPKEGIAILLRDD